MNGQLCIPDDSVAYILYQRTQYLRLPVVRAYRLWNRVSSRPLPLPLYNLAVGLEARLRPWQIKACYDADMRQEYASIRAYLPSRCAAILDIGCGVAGIDALLGQHYAEQAVELFLLDKSRVEPAVYYMFHRRAAFYNSLVVARSLLLANGIPADRIHLLEANERARIAIDRSINLVISLLSWGFHYPVETYLPEVLRLLGEDGRLILDVRKGTGGLAALRKHFAHVEPICETPKFTRALAAQVHACN